MRISNQTNHHVCLSCRLGYRRGRNTNPNTDLEHSISLEQRRKFNSFTCHEKFSNHTQQRSVSKTYYLQLHHSCDASQWRKLLHQPRQYSTEAAIEPIQLSSGQISRIGHVEGLKKRLQDGLANVPEAQRDSSGIPIEKLLKNLSDRDKSYEPMISLLGEVYAGKSFNEVESDLRKITPLRRHSEAAVDSKEARDVLIKLKIMRSDEPQSKQDDDRAIKHRRVLSRTPKVPRLKRKQKLKSIDGNDLTTSHGRKRAVPRQRRGNWTIRKILAKSDPRTSPSDEVSKSTTPRATRNENMSPSRTKVKVREEIMSLKGIEASSLSLQPLQMESPLNVPTLSFNLSRVLFNSGVYQLKDARSKVYNFDPYLERLMPVDQFNFDALNKYVTASEDEVLLKLAKEYEKRYTGSSSSLSSALSQFHFLLSSWRPLTMTNLSAEFNEKLRSFTQITRAPSAIFLRWRNGLYAVDADKQYDSANVLMVLGHAMEKLLTLDKAEYERYRLKSDESEKEDVTSPPEAYHYSGIGDFLFRSQLDAHDKRLPGTGMFDLKTRAVAGIRMNMDEYHIGQGYQIKKRLGLWESYEREFFDMVRSAFLKYSLQVRMGRMDGIFVAYHNISRIFGFQYLPLPELDYALHGQNDRCLGDQEFCLSSSIMNEIFNMATEHFPNQSLRFHFETREPSKTNPTGYMQIFAEAVDDEQIQNLQEQSKRKVETMQKEIVTSHSNGSNPDRLRSQTTFPNTKEVGLHNVSSQDSETPKKTPSTQQSTAADVGFLDKILGSEISDKSESEVKSPKEAVIGWTLHIYNDVNGRLVERPENLKLKDRWTVRYQFVRIADEKIRARYTSCKNRRKAALVFERGIMNTPFHRHLRELSLKGATWRKEQDDLEAEREMVTL